MIGVADRKGVGQGVLERKVPLVVVAHGVFSLEGRPVIHPAFVPGVLGVGPKVGRALNPHVGKGLTGIEGEGSDQGWALSLWAIGLHPDRGRLALTHIRNRNGEAVAKAPHPGHGSEIVIEAAVLLHEDDHMGDVFDRACAHVSVDRPGPRNGRKKACACEPCGQ